MAADIVIFDPGHGEVRPGRASCTTSRPAAGASRRPAEGISHTIVNGQVLLEDGKHTGALPGRVLRNSYWHANH